MRISVAGGDTRCLADESATLWGATVVLWVSWAGIVALPPVRALRARPPAEALAPA